MHTYITSRQRQRGYSLVELTVALVVAGVMIAIGTPSMSGYFRGRALERSLDTIISQLDLARHRAVSENNPYEVVFGAPEPDQISVHDDDNGNGVVDAGESVRVVDLGGKIAVADQDLLGDERVVFLPSGMLRAGQGGTVALEGPNGRERALEIYGSGKAVRVEKTT